MSRIPTVSAIAIGLVLVSATLAFADGAYGSSDAKPAKATTAAPAKHAMSKVDINSATREELMQLPGINEATADKIIAARPFKSKNDLVTKSIVTKAEYSKVSSRLTLKHLMAAK
jgi:DNA uptake protein ComE-like DNA-binding protein